MEEIHGMIVEQIPHLRRYARALLRDPIEADDLVQDCLTRAMERLHLWQPGSNLRAWLFAILHNQHVNQARRRSNRPDGVAMGPEHDDRQAIAATQESGVVLRDMARALDQLPDDQRHVLVLVGLEGLGYREAADIVGVPVGTVMSRLNRGRRKLREFMDQSANAHLRRVK